LKNKTPIEPLFGEQGRRLYWWNCDLNIPCWRLEVPYVRVVAAEAARLDMVKIPARPSAAVGHQVAEVVEGAAYQVVGHLLKRFPVALLRKVAHSLLRMVAGAGVVDIEGHTGQGRSVVENFGVEGEVVVDSKRRLGNTGIRIA
jgi:hypothetical protein